MPKKNTARLIVFMNALLGAEAPVETDTFLPSLIKTANTFNMQNPSFNFLAKKYKNE